MFWPKPTRQRERTSARLVLAVHSTDGGGVSLAWTPNLVRYCGATRVSKASRVLSGDCDAPAAARSEHAGMRQFFSASARVVRRRSTLRGERAASNWLNLRFILIIASQGDMIGMLRVKIPITLSAILTLFLYSHFLFESTLLFYWLYWTT